MAAAGDDGSTFVSAAHILARFPAANSFKHGAGQTGEGSGDAGSSVTGSSIITMSTSTTSSSSGTGTGAADDEDELEAIALTNSAHTAALSEALSVLKVAAVGAADHPLLMNESAVASDAPWYPVEQAGLAPKLPRGFPVHLSVPRNGQSMRDLLRRDYKEVQLELRPSSGHAAGVLEFGIGFSSIPLGMARLLTKTPAPGAPQALGLIEPRSRSTDRWDAWWFSLAAWIRERKLGMAVVGTSYRDELNKHRRELIIAYAPTADLPTSFWSSTTHFLLQDAHVPNHADPAAYTQRLLLDPEWKGERLRPIPAQHADIKVAKVCGKRERVGGLDEDRLGFWAAPPPSSSGAGAGGGGLPDLYAAVWKQDNAKANRKIYLPAVTTAVEKAAAS